jgi:hypothetical protein
MMNCKKQLEFTLLESRDTRSFFMNRVKSGEEVRQLPGVGPSVAAKAVLWIRNHFIPYPDPIRQVIPDPTNKTRQT